MDKPKDTIRVLDDLDLTVSMDSRADAGRQVTSIEAAIEPVILRVSFRDILLINSIINRAIELSNRSNASPPADVSNQKALETVTSGPKTRGRSKSEVTRGTKTQSSNRITDASLRAQVIVTKETVRSDSRLVHLDEYILISLHRVCPASRNCRWIPAHPYRRYARFASTRRQSRQIRRESQGLVNRCTLHISSNLGERAKRFLILISSTPAL